MSSKWMISFQDQIWKEWNEIGTIELMMKVHKSKKEEEKKKGGVKTAMLG